MAYLQQASFGGDDQNVRVAVVLSDSQQLFGGCGWPELEGRAGTSNVTSVRDITKLVELSIRFRNVITCKKMTVCVFYHHWVVFEAVLAKTFIEYINNFNALKWKKGQHS